MPDYHGVLGKLKPTVLNGLKLAGILTLMALGLVLACKLAGLIVPFLVAFVIAAMVEPLVRVLNGRLRLQRTLASVLALLIVVAVLAGALGLVAVKLVAEVRDFAAQLPQMYSASTGYLQGLLMDLDAKYGFIDDEFIAMVNQALEGLKGSVATLANRVTQGLLHTATSLPGAIVTLIVTILATFFIVRDREAIVRAAHRQLPESLIRRAKAIKEDLFSALFGYVRAILILMGLTFVELAIGFSIIRVEYALLLAFLIAIMDALPVLGTGTFVVPWACYCLLTGDIHTGVGLLIVFAVVWTVRQLLEPHVVGDQIGIHPLLTLLAMYLGMRFLGVFGMILGPVALIVLRNLVKIYTGGRTLREILYQGVEMPEEEKAKSRALAQAKQARPAGDGLAQRLAKRLKKK